MLAGKPDCSLLGGRSADGMASQTSSSKGDSRLRPGCHSLAAFISRATCFLITAETRRTRPGSDAGDQLTQGNGVAAVTFKKVADTRVSRPPHNRKIVHAGSRVPHTARYCLTHTSFSLLCTFPHVGCFSSTKKLQPIQVSCLGPTSSKDEAYHIALSRPYRSRQPALCRPCPAGSWGGSESWPWPRRERGSVSSVRRDRKEAFIYLRLNYSREAPLNKTKIDNGEHAALL